MDFTSGITGDNKYLISMEAYKEKDIPIAWNMSKRYQGLDKSASIDFNVFEEKWLTVEWIGIKFFPTLHNKQITGSIRTRVYNIRDNKKNVLDNLT